jgi:hypothetical protein
MSDNVQVPFGDNPSDTATLLLEAAQKKGYDPSVVTLKSDSAGNVFEVPQDVASAAKTDTAEKKPAAKKTAKKS